LTAEAPQTPRKRRWSWVWLALLVSLALNLAVLAAVVAHTVWGDGGRHHQRISGPGYAQIMPRAFFRQLDDKRRDELVGELREHRSEFRGLRRDLREKTRAIASALRAEPFDQSSLENAMADFEQASGTMITRGGEIARDLFSRLTPEERKIMADEIEKRSMSRRQWKRYREGGKEDGKQDGDD
jgi:Spy/CpxP family protein refolding chaperone